MIAQSKMAARFLEKNLIGFVLFSIALGLAFGQLFPASAQRLKKQAAGNDALSSEKN